MNQYSKYIQLGGNRVVSNPCYNPGENDTIFSGNVTDYSFKQEGLNQTRNYEKFKQSIEDLDFELEDILSIKYWYQNKPLVKFLIKCKDVNIFWYKYEGGKPGGGQSYVILNGKKIKFHNWIIFSKSIRKNLLVENKIINNTNSENL